MIIGIGLPEWRSEKEMSGKLIALTSDDTSKLHACLLVYNTIPFFYSPVYICGFRLDSSLFIKGMICGHSRDPGQTWRNGNTDIWL